MTQPVILCVDDEKIILERLRRQLRDKFGKVYTYEVAESAEEAMEVIDELAEDNEEIIVIISDWLMPDKKGDEFLMDVHERYPKIVKIMLTGQADDDAIERAKKHANLQGCLYKPWQEEELFKVIEAGLEQLRT
jgi:CheY-like chemotaxis protein